MNARLGNAFVGCAWILLLSAPVARAEKTAVLQNARVALHFDAQTGTLAAIHNKLTEETYGVAGDRFAVEAVEFRLDFGDAKLTSLKQHKEALTAQYQGAGMTIDVSYTLAADRQFAEKQLVLACDRPYGLKKLTLSRPTFSAAGLHIMSYRYPKFGRAPGGEPTCTFFGRTAKGGFFAGVEAPFDASSLDGRQVALGYAPSLKVAAGEKVVCEPAYFGVYRRGPGDKEQQGAPYRRPGHTAASGQAEKAEDLPLQAESDAMVAMTSAILGPFRFGLVPMACGWHCEMEQRTYTEQSVAGDMKSLDFLAECGIDWVSDSHPWGGETAKMNALGADDTYAPGPLVRKFLDHAQTKGVKVVMWSSMNNTHAWAGGKPFRADKPEWLMKPGQSVMAPGTPPWLKTARGNCLANRPFLDWLIRVNLDGMATGHYKSWAMDGDFFGAGGWYTSVIPVDCQSDQHDHLPGDSNYACQRALSELTARVRQRYPDTYIFMCRPPMDLGVWSLRNVDACFTLLESGTGKNLAAGDQIRTWSRVRVHRDFFPHYEDQPLLFPSRAGGPKAPRTWPSENIDYIMLSALSSSPNQLYYLPTKSGIPDKDKAEIRKWLDWGRKNVAYLKVRKDLPDWPAPGKVDGSAHFVSDRGLVFLFNSGKTPLKGRFSLSEESIGLRAKGVFRVAQEYPASDRAVEAAAGQTLDWEVPAQTAVVLHVQPAKPRVLQSVPPLEPRIAKGGQAQAAIVVGRNAGEFHRWVAGELQRYIKQLSGAELAIVADDKLPAGTPLIAVGGPRANALAAAAQAKRLLQFAALKPDGFVLKRIELEGVPVLLAGGNDDTGTMYAAYELLERLGIVFQLTGDIIPQQKPDLALPALDLRMEPAFKDRGMHCWHGIRWYMGLADFRREIDQLAKLKMNVIQFYWGMGGPWAEFSYGGKVVEITATKESGYVAWPGASGTANSVHVGRECFARDGYLGPIEFAKVQTPQDACRTARDFLRQLIRYAHSRKVQVWLTMGEIPFVPPGAVPPGSKRGRSFYCGVSLPPCDPAVLDIWEAALRSMIESYPEADRYWVVSGSELLGSTRPVHNIPADDPQMQSFIRDYVGLRPLIPPKSQAAANSGLVDLDLADIAAADKLVRRIQARYPAAKLGAELIFRGGQLRALDAALPKDVALMNMVNFAGETAMSYFDGIQGRDLVVWPRITDDGCELNMQLNAMMYDHDEVIRGGVRYGVTGILGQLNKARGAEQSAQYIAEGAWNPAIRCQSFYQRYLRRLYGPDALDALVKAFLLLEENEKTLGWHGRRGLFSTWCAGNRMGVALRRVDHKAQKLKIDPPELERAVQAAEAERKFWDGRAAHCGQALDLLRQARAKVPPGSREELEYVIYKTENFVTVFEELSAVGQAKAAFDRALLARNDGKSQEASQQWEQCRTALDRANRLVRQAAEQMIPYARIDPTERHILWIFNKAIPSHESARRYLAEVIAFRKAS